MSFALLGAAIAPCVSEARTVSNTALAAVAEQAFPVSAYLAADGNVVVSWSVRPSYQLYRASIHITPIDPAVSIGAIALPTGAIETDPYFGNISVLTGRVSASFPYSVRGAPPRTFAFTVMFRGCHIAAPQFCFPPITTVVNVARKAPSP